MRQIDEKLTKITKNLKLDSLWAKSIQVQPFGWINWIVVNRKQFSRL